MNDQEKHWHTIHLQKSLPNVLRRSVESALNSGRSDRQKLGGINVRFRPEAATQINERSTKRRAANGHKRPFMAAEAGGRPRSWGQMARDLRNRVML